MRGMRHAVGAMAAQGNNLIVDASTFASSACSHRWMCWKRESMPEGIA